MHDLYLLYIMYVIIYARYFVEIIQRLGVDGVKILQDITTRSGRLPGDWSGSAFIRYHNMKETNSQIL